MIFPSDVAAMRKAIADQRMPPWSKGLQTLIAVDGLMFVSSALAHLLDSPYAGALVTVALITSLLLLRIAPRPANLTPTFSSLPLSADVIGAMLKTVTVDTISLLEQYRQADTEMLLRVGHLQYLIHMVHVENGRRSVWDRRGSE